MTLIFLSASQTCTSVWSWELRIWSRWMFFASLSFINLSKSLQGFFFWGGRESNNLRSVFYCISPQKSTRSFTQRSVNNSHAWSWNDSYIIQKCVSCFLIRTSMTNPIKCTSRSICGHTVLILHFYCPSYFPFHDCWKQLNINQWREFKHEFR